MKYNFDEKIDRSGNHAAKWSELKKNYGRDDLIPMWVADMDFKVAPCIVEALREKVDQCIYGYTYRPESYYAAAVKWAKDRYGCNFDPALIEHNPGVVPALSILVDVFVGKNEKLAIFTPAYPPFFAAAKDNKRGLVEIPLDCDDAHYYTIDYDAADKLLAAPDVTWLLMCNPHNPTGRAWTREELEKVGNLCLKHNVRIFSDEIWRDLTLPGHKFTSFSTVNPEIASNIITLFSASKTFNLAGMQTSFVAFPDAETKATFDSFYGKFELQRNNPFGLVAYETAYTKGEDWLEELLAYLNANIDYTIDFIQKNMPLIKLHKPEATYLLWMDMSALGMDNQDLMTWIINDARLALSSGKSFGAPDHVRMNVACPRYMLEEGLNRLYDAYKKKF